MKWYLDENPSMTIPIFFEKDCWNDFSSRSNLFDLILGTHRTFAASYKCSLCRAVANTFHCLTCPQVNLILNESLDDIIECYENLNDEVKCKIKELPSKNDISSLKIWLGICVVDESLYNDFSPTECINLKKHFLRSFLSVLSRT